MTVKFTVYDTSSGAILRTGSTNTMAQAQAQAGPGEGVTTTDLNPDTQQVNPGTGAGAPLPVMSVTYGLNTYPTSVNSNQVLAQANPSVPITIINIPRGAMCYIMPPSDKGIAAIAPFEVNDTTLTLTTTVVGTYSVLLRLAGYQDFKVTFNAI